MKTEQQSESEMRVAIAKDVLKQLENDVYVARGVYFSGSGVLEDITSAHESPDNDDDINPDIGANLTGPQIQEEVKNLKSCQVCAIGAAIVSGIRLYDGVSGNMFDPCKGASSRAGQRFFTKEQLGFMEGIFEATSDALWCNADVSSGNYHYFQMVERSERMKIVFQSIIDNEGEVVESDMASRFIKVAICLGDKLKRRH